MKAKLTISQINKGSSAYQVSHGKQKEKKSWSQQIPLISEDEKKRRRLIKGKCFRCASADHMIPACKSLPQSSAIHASKQVTFFLLLGGGMQLTQR